MKKLLIVLLAVTAASACRGPSEPDDRWARPESIQYAASLNVDLAEMTRTPSGLYIQDLEVGEGRAAAAGDSVRVHYKGWLPDGTVFDDSYERNAPITFMLGVGLVIRGWDEGLVGMMPGGRRKLVIKPELAYGRGGRGPIPPLATLVFDVEMILVK
ncbi:MAG TPA: FKBP-type peptidyl-prolyl cis-trans isomerase [Longimicrobiales bacterium]|nr:FKBP-type peptidyl-prolyl cis-trans isomerase [Longimicrobiales bacterium]